MAKATDTFKPISSGSSAVLIEKPFETYMGAIGEIVPLENLTYDLYGLTKAIAVQFESHIELSPAADPKNPYARLIDQSAIESLVYLVQRSADIASELNAKLHEVIQRIPTQEIAL